jgi:hypothetical protein
MDVLRPPTEWLNGICYRKVDLPHDDDIGDCGMLMIYFYFLEAIFHADLAE